MCHTSTRLKHYQARTRNGTRAKIVHKSSSIYRQQHTTHGKGHTNTKKINHVICSGGYLAKVVSFVVVVILGMQPTLYVCKYHITTHCKSYTKIAFIFVFIYVRVRVCAYCSLKAKKFALYIAHFIDFVLKICIKTAQISFICCKRLKIQTFLVFCLVGCKYVCTFASQLRTKGNNKHNEDKKQEAARHITGQEEH